MKRSLSKLFRKKFDVIVVGAGIYGACAAAELSKAGYRVALIESADFGAATSANSMGILHGGLRYLQHLNIRRMQRFIKSRHFFMQLAPQLIDVTTFKLPLSGWGIKSPLLMRIALSLNDLISHQRNQSLPRSKHIPRSSVKNKKADKLGWFKNVPALRAIGIWHEAVVKHLERLVFEVVQLANEHGAEVINYCKAERLIVIDNELKGVAVKDRLSGQKGIVKANWIIDACGFKIQQLRARGKTRARHQGWVRAVNLMVRNKIIGDDAIALTLSDNLKDSQSKLQKQQRLLFFVPQRKHTVIGTFYDHQQETKNGLRLSSAEKEHYIAKVNRCHPDLNLKLEEVIRWQAGWLPAAKTVDQTIELESSSELKIYPYSGDSSHSGVIEVKGVKFTTAPQVAIDILGMLETVSTPSRPASKPNIDDQYRPPVRLLEHNLFSRYGRRWSKVKTALRAHPNHLRRIHPTVLWGEIHYACHFEMAQRLSDIMFRRMDFNLDYSSSLKLAKKISKIMRIELGWSDQRHQLELRDFHKAMQARR